MSLRIDPATLTKIAGRHQDAAEEIDSSAPTAPTRGADYGAGAAYAVAILAGVSETAGHLSVINQAVAAQVFDARDDLTATESQVAQSLTRMEQRLSAHDTTGGGR